MRGLGSFAVLLIAFAAATANATQDAAVCNLLCVQGKKCVVEKGVAKCIPIDCEHKCTKKCSKNEVCEINSADNSQYCYNPCAAVLCLSGTTCQLEQVQCIRAPCPPVAVCKPIKRGYGLRALNEEE
ncbi:hypothetical protein PHYSODRAFT_321055 [Phytophthora sojae]|uniref:TIL domain-containing protein n=1 Tax=Phytophthora sojae (strain P6497) TaxID=1094619 RepID=G4YP81_PHYSP|nr:hypothetical protein PHYSODRAFT_321055 [Phytophthora sojae]EGZ27215.1 hypothetical protein PHYSODRAFT_321055 [Phytophthora sojae]|eukprot:XP_009514490.1 hypothetical protein PHYSODRAFT_321055 [Phytophthora sojae]